MNKIILASNSPRRKELLEQVGIDFIIDASSIDETMDETLPLLDRFKKLATDKATPIHEKHPEDVVIGADTIVYFNNQIIGKPKDEADAKRILTMLSHHKHSVYTGVAIYFQDQLCTFVEKTDVYFKDIADLLDDYLDSLEWQGKAGAYGIQGKAIAFVDKVDGDRNNVIGLPITRVAEVLKQRKVL